MKTGKLILVVSMIIGSLGAPLAHAEEFSIDEGDIAMTVSPMKETMVLSPGEEYRSAFEITNPGVATEDLHYKLELKPFYVNENYDPVYEEIGDNSQIVDWITIEAPTRGAVHPNETATIEYAIKVPQDAPAGGQYASIIVSTDYDTAATGGVNIGEAISIAYLVLAEVAGETYTGGEIVDAGIDGFIVDGKVRVAAQLRNTGNVHALATFTMEVYPLFSPDALYSNAKDPETHYVLPNRTLTNETLWGETPAVGIFDVVYTVEYQGEVVQLSRVVVVCPMWLIVVVTLLLVILVLRIIALVKIHKLAKNKHKNYEKIVDSSQNL